MFLLTAWRKVSLVATKWSICTVWAALSLFIAKQSSYRCDLACVTLGLLIAQLQVQHRFRQPHVHFSAGVYVSVLFSSCYRTPSPSFSIRTQCNTWQHSAAYRIGVKQRQGCPIICVTWSQDWAPHQTVWPVILQKWLVRFFMWKITAASWKAVFFCLITSRNARIMSGVDQWKMAPFWFSYCCVLLYSLSLLLHFDSDMKHFMVRGLFDSISPKSIFPPYQFSVIILPWIAMACINLFSELMNSGFGSLATSSDPCKWKRRGKKKFKGWHAGFKPAKDIRFQRM